MAFTNKYIVTVENEAGEAVSVDLRLTAMAQVDLKKKYKESTLDTLMDAVDDVEKMIDVLSVALKWPGHENTVTSGAELYDLMAANDMLGHVGKAEAMTSLAKAAGLISQATKEQIDYRMAKRIDSVFRGIDGEDAEAEAEDGSKNA